MRAVLTHSPAMIIRPYAPSDLPELYVINQAGVPGVGDETQETLGKWLGLHDARIAVDDSGKLLGFINLLPPGTMEYTSANLRWLEAWGDDFIYVDRIAIAETARGQRILRPPNPGSLRFHDRLGFREIGRRSYADDTKEVVYLARPLA